MLFAVRSQTMLVKGSLKTCEPDDDENKSIIFKKNQLMFKDTISYGSQMKEHFSFVGKFSFMNDFKCKTVKSFVYS